ncbi:hypothetical protein C7Y47_14020 [Lysinibacillus sphaericus]|uniref:Uncharacterized protein n=1 Tax=Lysinibacillus sphaericus TaxID=1421 RepID=A0A544UGC2_LYSSH|nr:IS66 family insertion sequence element accessory protein TnpB [Lysinibacillus sp. SDF0037]TQR31731.1 hypothetical protein C7Y47_14020 [Lysinibacillus sp. SDF0037]
MMHDFTGVQNVYIRKGIDGLSILIQDSFELDPFRDSIFLFSGWSKDRFTPQVEWEQLENAVNCFIGNYLKRTLKISKKKSYGMICLEQTSDNA